MIGGLQGEFGDLDIKISKAKYLKMSVAHIRHQISKEKISPNVSRTYREALGENRGIVQNGCETLWVSVIRGSGYV